MFQLECCTHKGCMLTLYSGAIDNFFIHTHTHTHTCIHTDTHTQTHTHTYTPCLTIYGFIQNIRPHVLLQRTEWLQPAENLHGNKSYNLSPVCTLDWLKAITLTKKAFPPFLLFLLPALCQINPLNFSERSLSFLFLPENEDTFHLLLHFSLLQIWHLE